MEQRLSTRGTACGLALQHGLLNASWLDFKEHPKKSVPRGKEQKVLVISSKQPQAQPKFKQRRHSL